MSRIYWGSPNWNNGCYKNTIIDFDYSLKRICFNSWLYQKSTKQNYAFNQCIIFKKKPNEFHNRANILYQIDSCLIKPLTDCLSDYISNYEAIMLYKDLDEVTQILNKRTNQCGNIKVNNNWIIRVNNILSKCDECKCCFKPNNCQDLFGIKE